MWWSVRTDYVMSPPPLPALNPPSSIMITIEMDSLLFLSWFFRNERTHTFLSLLQLSFLWRCIQENIRNDISYLCHSHFLCSKRCSSVSLTLRLIWSVSLHLRSRMIRFFVIYHFLSLSSLDHAWNYNPFLWKMILGRSIDWNLLFLFPFLFLRLQEQQD